MSVLSIDNSPGRGIFKKSDYSVSTDYKSIDYTKAENEIYENFERHYPKPRLVYFWIVRWTIVILTALCVALVNVFIQVCKISVIMDMKNKWLNELAKNDFPRHFVFTYIGWILFGVFFMTIASGVCAFIEMEAAKGNLTNVFAYLNGISMKDLLTVRTIIVKIISTVTQLCTGIFGSDEDPVTHIGTAIGYLLPKFSKHFPTISYLMDPGERRDMALCGMAAGFGAALGSPIAGVLIAIEHITNNYNTDLLGRLFVCACVSSMFTTFGLKWVFWCILSKTPSQAYYNMLVHFGIINNSKVEYHKYEVFVYILMGALGGVMGGLWLYLSSCVTRLRTFVCGTSRVRLFSEALFYAALVSFFHISLMLVFQDDNCQEVSTIYETNLTNKYLIKSPFVNCGEGFIPKTSIVMTTFQHTFIFLIHSPGGMYSIQFLATLLIFYYIFGSFCEGSCVSSGFFTSHAILGALWGRIIGELFHYYAQTAWADPKKFAILGAAAHQTGVYRYYACIICFLMESTDSYYSYAIPLFITAFTGKHVAQFIHYQSYHNVQFKLRQIPFLAPHPTEYGGILNATQIMNASFVHLPLIASVDQILKALKQDKGNYPVLNADNLLLGDISKRMLCCLLWNKVYDETQPLPKAKYARMYRKMLVFDDSPDVLRNSLNHFKNSIDEADMEKMINLTPFINKSFYMVLPETFLSRIHLLFRQLGVHTLYVLDRDGLLIGVITRERVAQYQLRTQFTKVKYEKMVLV